MTFNEQLDWNVLFKQFEDLVDNLNQILTDIGYEVDIWTRTSSLLFVINVNNKDGGVTRQFDISCGHEINEVIPDLSDPKAPIEFVEQIIQDIENLDYIKEII